MKIKAFLVYYVGLLFMCAMIAVVCLNACKEVETQEEFFERTMTQEERDSSNSLPYEPIGLVGNFEVKDLYIMTGHIPGVYKIGRSNDPKRRVKEIDYLINGKTDQDVWLVKVYPNQGHLESKIHKLFREQDAHLKYHTGTSSTEWFRFTLDDLCEIDRIILKK